MPDDFDTGATSQVAAENTGVEGAQVAAEQGSEENVSSENTPFEMNYEEPVDLSLEDLLNGTEPEKVENAGDDNPPETGTESKPDEKPEASKQQDISQSKAFSIRLQQEKAKVKAETEAAIRKEYEEKYKTTFAERVDGRAYQLMQKFPDTFKNFEYAKHQAEIELKSEETSTPQVKQPEAPADDAESRKKAWINKIATEEPSFQAALGDYNMTVVEYTKKDPIFKSVLTHGIGPMDAYDITKAVRAILQQEITAAKAQGGQDVINNIKSSNGRATTPVTNTKTTGKHKTVVDLINDTPLEELNKMLQNGRVNLGG